MFRPIVEHNKISCKNGKQINGKQPRDDVSIAWKCFLSILVI